MNTDKKKYLYVGILLIGVYLFTVYWQSLVTGVSLVIGAATPLIVGAVIAYLVNILMSFFERLYFPRLENKFVKKSRRPLCMLFAMVGLVLILVVVVTLIVPELVNCISTLVMKIPTVFWRLEELFGDYAFLEDIFAAAEKQIFNGNINWQDITSKVGTWVVSGLGGIMGTIGTIISSTFSVVATFVIGLVFAIYLLSGKERLHRQAKNILRSYLKTKWVERIDYFFTILNDCFHDFVVGQCMEAVILGGLCILGMMICRFPYATMIGTFVGFTALIPIVGAYLGAGVGMLMIFTVSPMQSVFFLIFILVLQQLEGNLIYPRVVGASIGLPGIWVLAAVTVGGGIFGIGGMLIGVPFSATVYRLLKNDVRKRLGDQLEEEPLTTLAQVEKEIEETVEASEETAEKTEN